jgi:hypothetical protein
MSRRGGIIFVAINGTTQNAKGNWTYNLGEPKATAIVGADTVHGHKEMPQVPFIEGAITDRGNLDLAALLRLRDATVTLQAANGKTIALRDAFYAGEGNVTTEEGEIAVRFEGLQAVEVS